MKTGDQTAATGSGLMAGKRGVIMGVANDHSIAWGIARKLAAHGADLAFTYQGDALAKRVRPLAESVGSDLLFQCDVEHDTSINDAFEAVADVWSTVDFLVHAIAYSDKDELNGRYAETTRENFRRTMDVSCYSFTAAARAAAAVMPEGGSLVTLSFSGAERVVPNYNVMGVAKAALEASVRYLAQDLGKKNIRVNALSAGPIKTLAAAGVGDFRYILKWNELNAPLRRTVSISDVGDSALFLLSDLSRGMTGEVMHVDAGYNIVGMKAEDAPDIAVALKENGA